MRWIQKVFHFYLDASIHVGLSILSLVYVTSMLLEIYLPVSLAVFVFFGAVSCYNFVKFGVEVEKYILVTNSYHKNIQFFSLGCLLVALSQLFYLSEEVFFGLMILGGITGLYALPVLPKHRNFRSFSGLKILIVALVWAGTTVILPVLASSSALGWNVWIETAQRFLLVLVLLVPFEIRDLKYDSLELKTLPQRLGVSKTKVVGVVWVVLFLLLSFLMTEEANYIFLSKGLLAVVLIGVVISTKVDQGPYYCSFWVEAIPMFWLGFLLFSKAFV